MPLSEQQQEHVKKQVEFYFSDSNLPFDKFLFESATAAEDGWLDLSVIVAFKRMQQILKTEAKTPDEVSSEDVEEVGKLLKDSATIEISEDGYQIRRRDMPTDWEAVKAAVDARSVHAEPLPHSSTIESVGTLFAQHGEVRQVRLQRFVDPSVKGGVFAGAVVVELGTAEEAQQLLTAGLQHAGAALRLQTKAAYQEARQAAGLKDGQRDLRTHCPEVTTEGLPEDPPEAASSAAAPAAAAQESAAEEPYDEGCFVRFEVQGEAPDAMPHGAALRTLLGGADEGLAYVDYSPSVSKQQGQLRFNAKEHADACLLKAGEDGLHTYELPDDGGTLTLKMAALAGDEEAAAWRNYRQASRARDAREENKGTKRRGGHQGRGGKRGRH